MADDNASEPVAIFLRDAQIGLRAPTLDDADHSAAWHDGQVVMPPHVARRLLSEQESIPWGANPTIRLMVVALDSNTVVGGVLVRRSAYRVSEIRITAGSPLLSDEARQHLNAAVLRLVVPWVMGELDLMTTRIDVPADETILIEAAHQLGMTEAVRLREFVARPASRVDLLMLELVNHSWGQRHA